MASVRGAPRPDTSEISGEAELDVTPLNLGSAPFGEVADLNSSLSAMSMDDSTVARNQAKVTL